MNQNKMLTVIMAFLLAAGACDLGQRAPTPDTQVTPDGAVESTGFNPPLMNQEAVLQSDLRIGAVDGEPEYTFDRIRSVAVTESGDILVLNDGTGHVRVFSATGQFIRSFGGRGEGPGEWEFGALMFYGHGVVAVVDHRTRVFDMDGTLIAHFVNQTPEGSFTLPFARTPDGWLATTRSVTPGARSAGQIMTDSINVKLLDESGEPLRAVLTFPARRVVIGEAVEGERMDRPPLFDGRPRMAADSEGRIYVTDREAYRVSIYSNGGRLVRTVQRGHAPTEITPDHLDSYAQHVRGHLRDGSSFNPEAEIRLLVDQRLSLPRPNSLPALGRLLVATDGAIWVERPDLAPDPGEMEYISILGGATPTFPASKWDRFNASGEFVGTVGMPASFTPFSVLENSVVGVQRDELGVEYVVRYRIGL